MPSVSDILPWPAVDNSCSCVLSGFCANVADAVPGRWEGRNLHCQMADAARRTARCHLDARFVEQAGSTERASRWQRKDGLFHNYKASYWCAGDLPTEGDN